MPRPGFAFIADKSYPMFIGGYEERIWQFASGIADEFDVRVFSSVTADQAREGVTIHRMCTTFPYACATGERSKTHSVLFAARAIKSPLKDWIPQAVYVESIPYLHLLSMRNWIRKVGAKVILNFNEAWSTYESRGIRGMIGPSIPRLIRVGLDWSDVPLSVSHVTAASLQRSYGETRTRVVPTGIPVREIQDTVQQFRERESPEKFDVVTVGRLVDIKRHKDVISALALLVASGEWAGRAAIVGEGPERANLERLIRSNGLQKHVVLLGFVDRKRKFEILANSMIFVLASEREGFSLAALEAQATGLPVIVARPTHAEVFGPSDYVIDGENGIFFPVGDVQALAKSVGLLLTNQRLRRQMGARAVSIVEPFDVRHVLSAFRGLVL